MDALRAVCCERVMLSILADEGLSIGSATHSEGRSWQLNSQSLSSVM